MLPCASRRAISDKPVKAASPLSGDEVSIYSAVLRQYGGDKGTALNVSKMTYPLDPQFTDE